MIKANELRVGNLVKVKVNGNYTIVSYHHIRIVTLRPDEEIYMAIPLTAEILMKCGFKRKVGTELNIFDKGKIRIAVDIHCWFIITKDGEDTEIGGSIFNLHTLQNIYPIMNDGEELQITEI